MKFHIVRNRETLEDILYIYNLKKDELIENNKHIRVWDKLIPGTKLKIPSIPDAVDMEVTDMEPFVEDYYPTLTEDNVQEVSLKVENDYQEIDDKKENEKSEDNAKPKLESSKIYEDYGEKNVKKEDVKDIIKEVKKEEKKLDIPEINQMNHYSNMYPKPLLNNYYPYYIGVYNAPRYIPYPIIYYPIYIQKK